MPSKKKSKVLFEVPADVESGADSGWVYRSERDSAAGPEGADTGIGAASATVLALAIATMAQFMVLGITIGATPWTIGLRALRSLDRTG
jgi:hypothetical protein